MKSIIEAYTKVIYSKSDFHQAVVMFLTSAQCLLGLFGLISLMDAGANGGPNYWNFFLCYSVVFVFSRYTFFKDY